MEMELTYVLLRIADSTRNRWRIQRRGVTHRGGESRQAFGRGVQVTISKVSGGRHTELFSCQRRLELSRDSRFHWLGLCDRFECVLRVTIGCAVTSYRSGMSTTAPTSGRDGVHSYEVVLSIVVIFVLAIAQPVLDLLGRNAEFFLARAAPPADLVILALLLTFLVPLVIGLTVVGIRRIHYPTGTAIHGAILGVLGAVLALQVVDLTLIARWPVGMDLVISLVIGTVVAIGFYEIGLVRLFVRFLAIAPIATLSLFLFTSASSELLFNRSASASPIEIAIGNGVPVVMVVFDEFPVASLMDGEGNLQEDIYPNFARLAQDGTWFRNATSVQQQTEGSLPAILSGSDSPEGKIPIASDYPNTLFTLLADSYEFRVQEAVTDLCPDYACDDESRTAAPAIERWKTLLSDLRIVAGHLFLPNAITENLPTTDGAWSNFSGAENPDFDVIARFRTVAYDGDRRARLAEFLHGIEPAGAKPRLNFLHTLVPHVPWSYLPSGQTYPTPNAMPGSVGPGWGDDVWLVDQAYQQHLVQVQFVDSFIGDMIDDLEAAGIYDDALVLVLADHGITVRPNIVHRRHATKATIGDIASIPLFIKFPNQEGGTIDDYRAETVDILPTVADVLEVEVPWAVEGTSLHRAKRPERIESTITGDNGVIAFGVDGSEAKVVASRKIDHFGTYGPFGLAPPGQADLLGLPIAEIDVRSNSGAVATIENLAAYSDIELDGPSLPLWIKGRITATQDKGDAIIAVVVNGAVAAVTRAHTTDEGTVEYGALIPPGALLDGENEIEILLVALEGSMRTFNQITR
jgi:hypothetical protein